MMTQYLLLAISYNMELSETKIKIFCNFAAYCRNNIFVLPMKIRLFTIPNLLTLASLLCGSFAVVSALVYGDLALAFWLTIAAAATACSAESPSLQKSCKSGSPSNSEMGWNNTISG